MAETRKLIRIVLLYAFVVRTSALRLFSRGCRALVGFEVKKKNASILRSTLGGDDRIIIPINDSNIDINRMSLREEDFEQSRDLDLILSERAKRYNDPKVTGRSRELCLLVAVDEKLAERKYNLKREFTLQESLNELSELVGTAGLDVKGVAVQKLSQSSRNTYVGPGKIEEIMEIIERTGAKTVVIDDDLTPKQQRGLESAFGAFEGGEEVKVLDRTAVILEIFAQHANTKEGQLQVELAQLQYRLTRGPNQGGSFDASGPDRDSGAGFRGPGESKLETDKRAIRQKIVQVKKEIALSGSQRANHRKGRERLGLPLVALVGYTNAGKSTILNRMTRAGVLAENMLFATLDSTVRKVRLNKADFGDISNLRGSGNDNTQDSIEVGGQGGSTKGQEVLLTDTVGFISKIPADLVVAFRSTLEQVKAADVLVHVCDRSNPIWRKQRDVVLSELAAIGCTDTPIVELWNKVDQTDDPEGVMEEARSAPVEAELIGTWETYKKDLPGGQYQAVGEHDDTDSGGDIELDEEDEYAPIRAGQEPEALGDGRSDVSRQERRALARQPSEWSSGDTESSKWHKHNEKARQISARGGHSVRRQGSIRAEDAGTGAVSFTGKTYIVAASAKTGFGFPDFVSTLEDALSLRLRKVEIFVPYDKDDGLIDTIHTLGKVDEAAYGNAGTSLVCRIPDALYAKLRPYIRGRGGENIGSRTGPSMSW
jgi:GTP-binding protein HflX